MSFKPESHESLRPHVGRVVRLCHTFRNGDTREFDAVLEWVDGEGRRERFGYRTLHPELYSSPLLEDSGSSLTGPGGVPGSTRVVGVLRDRE